MPDITLILSFLRAQPTNSLLGDDLSKKWLQCFSSKKKRSRKIK